MPGDDGCPPFQNLRELEVLARQRVSEQAFDYVVGGAGDEASLSGNERAWSEPRLHHRVLVDVADRGTATTVLGTKVGFPALVAPTAFHKLMHPEGEVATARGAAQAGALMVASTLSTTPLEVIAAASPGPSWFQLYIYKDRKLTEALVERAEAAGYGALVLTVDAPVWGRRERDVRNRFSLPAGMELANFPALAQETLPAVQGDGLAAYVERQLDPSLTWEAVDWLGGLTDLPIVVKGVVHPEDARLAVEHGAAGVVVSNHGGRQLDHGVPTVHALPGVVRAVEDAGGGAEVYVDGGVRRGTDVVKALALGARAVLVGRPVLWALAVGGAEGVAHALQLLKAEVDNAMALVGARRVADINSDVLASPG